MCGAVRERKEMSVLNLERERKVIFKDMDDW